MIFLMPTFLMVVVHHLSEIFHGLLQIIYFFKVHITCPIHYSQNGFEFFDQKLARIFTATVLVNNNLGTNSNVKFPSTA